MDKIRDLSTQKKMLEDIIKKEFIDAYKNGKSPKQWQQFFDETFGKGYIDIDKIVEENINARIQEKNEALEMKGKGKSILKREKPLNFLLAGKSKSIKIGGIMSPRREKKELLNDIYNEL